MSKIIASFFALVLLFTALSCSNAPSASTETSGGDTPTETYKRLYAAVKAKDIETIKSLVSKKTHDLANMASQRNNVPIDKVYENGFTATTFSPTLPEIRDERVSDDMGAVEVYNSKDSRWEDLPFVREDGGWKLAFGDQFAGTYKSPGMGRDQKEKIAANSMPGANSVVPANVVNTNTNVKMIVPKERPENSSK
ncbi:MAG TPA: hypothetical protein VGQ55_16725 [Pyrinomonadaceae bacterium]|jgi:hypothetical protein|nr:hypothetical protein [Pyrinomonadaceae bacterium]